MTGPDDEARRALMAWGEPAEPPRLIKDRENAVYEVLLRDGTRAALRLHRAGYQSAQAIRSELWWTGALADLGLSVPRPVPTRTGALLHAPRGGRLASLIGWVDGAPLGEAGVPLAGGTATQRATFHAVGAAVARLHAATDALDLPADFTRPRWDIAGLLGENPLWGRFWDNPALTPDERDAVLAARHKAALCLTGFAEAGGDFGLIHADVLRENVFLTSETVTLMDFDDCGFGFRIYDLATLASQNQDQPDRDALMAAAIAGYRSKRALDDKDVALLPMALMLRRFASCGWIVPRAAPDDPAVRKYAMRAASAARTFLAD